jgi:hypothetical protein
MRVLLVLFILLSLVRAEAPKAYLYVRYDAEAGKLVLSDGRPLPPGLPVEPGQYVELKGGFLKPKRQWQPPQDILKEYTPQGASRVVFSHERHFAALGVKGSACQTCHATLDIQKTWRSLAPEPRLEPHKATSLGRFCATCHDGKTRIRDIPGARSPLQEKVFSALGRSGDPGCSQCHAPRDHGLDFTSRHGEVAEHGGGARCATCHRGAGGITPKELAQALDFRQAQLALIRNPEDAKAFNVVLPNNFCAYCHALDLKAWKGKD